MRVQKEEVLVVFPFSLIGASGAKSHLAQMSIQVL